MSAERSNRSSSGRRPSSGRPAGPGSSGRRPSGGRDDRPGAGSRRAGSSGGERGGTSRGGSGRSGAGRTGGGRSGPGRGGSGRPGDNSRGDKFDPKWKRDLDEPLTAAQQRAKEVDARRGGPRPEIDPDRDRRWADERSMDQWVDEGSVRDVAEAAASRAGAVPEASVRREPRPLDPEIGAQLVDALGGQRGARLSERLAQASEALDRERFDEARRLAAAIAKEAPLVSAVQEVLGLASYRLGRYKPAVAALQQAQELHENPALLPVIADAYRGLRRWAAVERVWGQIKAASPSQDILAEGRIVMAGAFADQGDLASAIAVMLDGRKAPKRIRDHHLREWYVLGDLYDRSGDPIAARRWFSAIGEVEPQFVDVSDRLRGLGR